MRNGVVTVTPLGVTQKSVAKRLEAALITRIAEGKMGIGSAPTLQEFSTEWVGSLPGKVRPETYRAYTAAVLHLQQWPALANAPLDQIHSGLVDAFVQQCRRDGYATATINLRIRVLRRILHVAAERRLISFTPTIHGLRGEGQREAVITTADEPRLIEAAERLHPTMGKLLPFLIDTGLRIGEACALTWADATAATIRVREGKTKFARRIVPLTKRAAEILVSLRLDPVEAAAPIFTRSGKAISPTWATQHFIKARRGLSLPEGLVLHCTRHTFCTRLGAAGASPFEIQRLAGHSNIQISARYAHPDEEQLTKAIDKLNNVPISD